MQIRGGERAAIREQEPDSGCTDNILWHMSRAHALRPEDRRLSAEKTHLQPCHMGGGCRADLICRPPRSGGSPLIISPSVMPSEKMSDLKLICGAAPVRTCTQAPQAGPAILYQPSIANVSDLCRLQTVCRPVKVLPLASSATSMTEPSARK